MSWVLANLDLIAARTLSHLAQAIPAVLAAFLLSVPIARLVQRRGWLRGGISTGSALLYAVPSLPLFIIMPAILGTGIRDPLNVVIALTIYGAALMVPSAIDAFGAVDGDVLRSATAQGYTPMARFWQVELPLAGPVLVTGLRVVCVSTISLVTVGGVLGIPSLGMLFVDGFQRGILAQVVTGVALTALIALVLDALVQLLGWLVLPWARAGGAR